MNAVYTPSLAEVNAGSVTLTLTSNDPAGLCGIVSDQVLIIVNQPAVVNAGIDQTVCGSSTVNLVGSASGSTSSVSWSGGNGVFTPNNTSLNAIYTPNAADILAGFVTLTLTSNDPSGPCGIVSDQVVITVNQPATVNAGVDQVVCGNSTVDLAGTQGGSASSVAWSGGNGTFNPNNTLLNAVYSPTLAEISAGSVTLTLTSDDPVGICNAVSDQVFIAINQSATVNAGIDQIVCGTTPVVLSGTLGGSASAVTWSGDGSGTFSPNNTSLNAVYTPTSADVASGGVTLTMISNDPIGPCPVVSDQVFVTVNTVPILVTQDTLVLCSGENLNYAVVTNIASNIDWFASNNTSILGETTAVQNSNFIADNLINVTNTAQFVTYNFDLISQVDGCQSTNQILIVQVNPLPFVDSVGDLFYCSGELSLPILFNSSIQNTNFTWTNSNAVIGLAANGTGDIPAFVPINTTASNIVSVITVTAESAGCVGNTISFNLVIGEIPNVVINPAGPFCVSSPSVNLVTNFGNGTWSGPGIVNAVTGEFDPTFANIGVNVISYNLNGVCGGGSSIDILVYPNPEASFTTDNFSTTVLNPIFYFENTSINSTSYTWNFGDGTSSVIENPIQTYPGVIGYYIVELIATNNSGCVDTVSNFVYVEEETIFFVPNAFTPDGNEINNIFQPVFSEGYDPDYYVFRIFNRWGEVVFETTNVLNGWDGTLGGFMCQDGTYVWSLLFKVVNSDLVYRYEGHLTLFR